MHPGLFASALALTPTSARSCQCRPFCSDVRLHIKRIRDRFARV
jgi:hypothetical protein